MYPQILEANNEIGDAVKKGLRLCTANKKFSLPIIL